MCGIKEGGNVDEHPQIIGVSGFSACGKSTFISEFQAMFERSKIQRVSIGDVVRRKMKDKRISITYKSLQVYNDTLMEECGKRYMSIIFEDVEDYSGSDVVFVDAVRTLSDFETLHKKFGHYFFTIGFICADEVRYSRVVSRARPDDLSSRADFNDLTKKEVEWGVVQTLELAALTIDSNHISLENQCDYVYEYIKRRGKFLC